MKTDHRLTSLFGQQTTLCGAQPKVALPAGLVIGPSHQVGHAHQRLTLFHLLALAHQHLLDGATLQMLHRFAFGIHRHHRRGRHAFVEWRKSCPQQKSAKADAQCPQPEAGDAASVAGCMQGVDVNGAGVEGDGGLVWNRFHGSPVEIKQAARQRQPRRSEKGWLGASRLAPHRAGRWRRYGRSASPPGGQPLAGRWCGGSPKTRCGRAP